MAIAEYLRLFFNLRATICIEHGAVGARSDQPDAIEHLAQVRRGVLMQARELDAVVAHLAQGLEHPHEIDLGLLPQTVKLNRDFHALPPDRCFSYWCGQRLSIPWA